jgi:hypothetical protein
MCGRPLEPHGANLLYLAMGLRIPRSEYSPEPPINIYKVCLNNGHLNGNSGLQLFAELRARINFFQKMMISA